MKQLSRGHDDVTLLWLAHHVARLISEAEVATGDEEEAARDRCYRAILALWQARQSIFERAPLRTFDEIANALVALQKGEHWFFERPEREQDGAAPRELQLAYRVDSAARGLIRTLVGDAVRRGAIDDAEWIALLGPRASAMPEIRILLEEADVTSVPPASEQQVMHDERQAMIRQLEAFVSAADKIAAQLRASPPKAPNEVAPN